MLTAADETGAAWVAVGLDPNTGEVVMVPAETMVLRVEVAPVPEPETTEETVDATAEEIL